MTPPLQTILRSNEHIRSCGKIHTSHFRKYVRCRRALFWGLPSTGPSGLDGAITFDHQCLPGYTGKILQGGYRSVYHPSRQDLMSQSSRGNLHLAPHVQAAMEDSIKKLRKYGACKDLLWFGFGVKHVVTDLSETEEGLALVTLASSILTCVEFTFSATVLRELCLISGGLPEFMASLS